MIKRILKTIIVIGIFLGMHFPVLADESQGSGVQATSQQTETNPKTLGMGSKNHIVQINESLWGIAKEFYGDPLLWPEIYRANKNIITDPNKLVPGKKILIPFLQQSTVSEQEVVSPSKVPTSKMPPSIVAPSKVPPSRKERELVEVEKINKVLRSIMPRAKPDSVKPSALPGIYEAIFGAQVIYISKNGRYILEGDLYDLNTRTNLTEGKRRVGRAKVVNDLDANAMIVFSPKKVKHIITAFTDIDCGYCRKMHKRMAEYNELGIEFRYLAYPRSGVGSPSYLKALSVWCAKDPQEAMSFAKGGAKLAQIKEITQVKGKDCKDTILGHMAAAKQVGVTGTPTLVFDNGQVAPGYVEPKRLIQILNQMKKG